MAKSFIENVNKLKELFDKFSKNINIAKVISISNTSYNLTFTLNYYDPQQRAITTYTKTQSNATLDVLSAFIDVVKSEIEVLPLTFTHTTTAVENELMRDLDINIDIVNSDPFVNGYFIVDAVLSIGDALIINSVSGEKLDIVSHLLTIDNTLLGEVVKNINDVIISSTASQVATQKAGEAENSALAAKQTATDIAQKVDLGSLNSGYRIFAEGNHSVAIQTADTLTVDGGMGIFSLRYRDGVTNWFSIVNYDSDYLDLRGLNGKTFMIAMKDSYTELKYNGIGKIRTDAAGVKVYGDIVLNDEGAKVDGVDIGAFKAAYDSAIGSIGNIALSAFSINDAGLSSYLDIISGSALSCNMYLKTSDGTIRAGILSDASGMYFKTGVETGIIIKKGAEVQLWHNNLQKFVTTATGVQVNGTVNGVDIGAFKTLVDNFISDTNTLLTSDDTTLDELQEIVEYIKQNKSDLETLEVSNIAGLQNALDTKIGTGGTKLTRVGTTLNHDIANYLHNYNNLVTKETEVWDGNLEFDDTGHRSSGGTKRILSNVALENTANTFTEIQTFDGGLSGKVDGVDVTELNTQAKKTGFKNLILNSGFKISQSGDYKTNPVVLGAANGTYYLDMNYANAVNVAGTIQQLSGYPTVNDESVELVATSSATGYIRQVYKMENILEGHIVTVSADVKSNSSNARLMMLTDTWHETVETSRHSGNEEWERLYFTFTAGARLTPELLMGIVGNGHANVAINSGDYIRITNLQLEKNIIPTVYEEKIYELDLSLCQTHYREIPDLVRSAGSRTSVTGKNFINIPFFSQMRVAPSVSFTDGAGTLNKITYHATGLLTGGIHGHSPIQTYSNKNSALVYIDTYTGYDCYIKNVILDARL